jgi:hypothetical protein
MGLPIIAILMTACDTQPVSPSMAGLSIRSEVADKLPQGAEVLVSLMADPASAVGAIFMVQGTGNSQSAYCLGSGLPNNSRLYLRSVTLVGGASDPESLRNITDSFSTEMPPGTKFQVVGLYSGTSGFASCAGNPVFRAVVVNGS